MVSKRFLKTVLCMLCVFTLAVGCVSNVSAGYNDVMFDLTSLGVLEGIDVSADLNANITRAEFSQLVVNLLGYYNVADTFEDLGVFADIASSKYNGAINLLYDLKVISGTGPNTFSPDNYVTYPQVGKFMVNILGYSNIVKSTDLYAYSMLAGSLGVYDDVDSTKEYVTWADALVIAHNALDIDIMTKDFSMIGDNYHVVEGKTLRSSLSTTTGKDVKKYKGIVTADADTYLYEARANMKSTQVEVNGKIYNCSFEVPGGLVGMEVNFYIDYSEDTDGIVTSIAPSEKNDVVKIYLDEITDSSADTVKYLINDESTTKIKVNTSAKVVYNGRWDMSATAADIINYKNGYVRLIDNDEDGYMDIIFVYEFTDAIVERIYSETKQVYFANSQTVNGARYVSFDEEEKDISVNIMDADGNDFAFQDIKVDNIISLAISKDGQVVNAVISDKIVTGVLKEIDDYSVVIGTDVYDYVTKPDVKVGSHVDAYVNFMNKVFYMEKTSAIDNYAYVLNAQTSGGISDDVKVALILPGYISETSTESFDDDGTADSTKELFFRNKSKVIYELASKVRVEGLGKEDGTKTSTAVQSLIIGNVISYSLNSDNKINKIEILKPNNNDVARKYYNENGKTFSSYNYEGFGITESATMSICVPSNSNASDDDMMMPVKLAHGKDYSINAYDVDETSSIAGLVVITESMLSGEAGSISPATSQIAVLKKSSRVINENGEEVIRVNMLTKDGEKSYVVSPLSSSTVQNRFASLNKGDLFYYETIAATEELRNCQLLQAENAYEGTGAFNLNQINEFCIGTVEYCRYSYVSQLKNRWTDSVTINYGGDSLMTYEIFKTGTPVIFIMDEKGNAELGTFDDIQCGNTIYVGVVQNTVRAIVIRK